MENSHKIISQLVEDFKANDKVYLSSAYQELQVREDFINKFFVALGWDVTHTTQKDPYRQEVSIENRVATATSQRRADYAFYISPNFRDVQFFVEAKKPSQSLLNPRDYYQTIRYGWNAGTPIAVLTDFEEFHILDCRYKPDIKDILNRRVEYYHYSQYPEVDIFSRIFYLFGRNAVAEGSLEKYAENLPMPRGKSIQGALFKGGYKSVDEDFLELLDIYRVKLAHAFKKKNLYLDGEALTEAVQRTIDRLVFIRFLEDKGIIEPEIIGLYEKQSSWSAFLGLCKHLEPKYNGLIFKPHPILDGKEFQPPDDRIFADICAELSDPSSPYDFNQIPISILGNIYERFLGKVVYATKKLVKVESKPEVIKAGGVFYTPEFIVRYIVKETVSKLIDGLTPKEISKLAFADIACGSGSFLIEVYDQLLEYHVQYYLTHPTEATKDDVFIFDGKLRLTLAKKKEILTNNIFGVDIDYQATEVTQLSLYLKLLEHATMQDAHQFAMFKEKILPDLRQNIICGNSVVGRDFVESTLFSNVDEAKLKPMNYEDAFPIIMRRGGFDAIVGNPPYVRQESLGIEFKKYAKKTYRVFAGTADLYAYFFEKAHNLLKVNGLFGMISSNKFMRTKYGKPLREFLATNTALLKIIDFGELPVFQNAATFPAIFLTQKSKNQNQKFLYAPIKRLNFTSLESEIDTLGRVLDDRSLSGYNWSLTGDNLLSITEKIKNNSTILGEYVKGQLFRGILTGCNEAFIIDAQTRNRLIQENRNSQDIIKPFCVGDDVRKYQITSKQQYIIFTRRGIELEEYPAIQAHLEKYKERLMPKPKKWKGGVWKGRKEGNYAWYEIQDSIDYYKEFEKPKIVYPEIAKESRFTIDKTGYYLNKTCFFIPLCDYYLLGILNSTVTWFFLKNLCSVLGDANKGGRLLQQSIYMNQIPIRNINSINKHESSCYEFIVKNVEQQLDIKARIESAITEAEKNRLENLYITLNRQIDDAVYALYGLTDEEKKIVEQTTP